jgi:small multidrug resistance pump
MLHWLCLAGAIVLEVAGTDMSVSYAIWSGVGTALIALIGFGWFKEPVTALKVLSIFLIVVGVVGLNVDAWRMR